LTNSSGFETSPEGLADLVRRAQEGDAWHGSSVGELVEGLSAVEAAARPVHGAHSIWEIVLHLTSWRREVARRLTTGVLAPPEAGDWPAVPAVGDRAWAEAIAGLAASTGVVRDALATFPRERLGERAGEARDQALGSGFTWGGMVLGLVQHDAYHGGQIGILKRALAVEDGK